MKHTLVEPSFGTFSWILKVILTVADFYPLTPDPFYLITNFQLTSEQAFIILDVEIIKEVDLFNIFQHTLKIGAVDVSTTEAAVDIDMAVINLDLVLGGHLSTHGHLGFDGG